MSYRLDSIGVMAGEAMGHYSARRLREAEVLYRKILAVDPHHAEALGMMGVLALEMRLYGEAERYFRRSLEIEPGSVGVLNNLGVVMRQTGRLGEAVVFYRQALVLAPDYLPVVVTLGSGLRDMGETEEAVGMYERALAMDGNYAEAHLGLASIYLRRGDFARGWEEYEWRRKYGAFAAAHARYAQPQWDGAGLEGRTILVHVEQGLGDTLNFIRYVPLVAERGGRVVMFCQKELKGLLAGSVKGVSQWVTAGETMPMFDVQCSLLSLPRIFGTRVESIPEQEVIEAGKGHVGKWREILADDGEGLRVGLCWSGNPGHVNDGYRSIALAGLKELGEVGGVNFYSLQKNGRASDMKLPLPICFFDYTEELGDFSDTAGLVANLDLVITVDTSVVHLAGVMRKPAWLMVPAVGDWRWLEKREDSPWYRSVRLFRQEKQGEWGPVVKRVRGELETFAAGARRVI